MGNTEIKEHWGLKWVTRPGWRTPFEYETLNKQQIDWLATSDKKEFFLDLGANEGLFSISLSPVFKKILAIEPHPTNVKIFKENVKLNGVKNIRIMQKAAWSSETQMRLAVAHEKDYCGDVGLTSINDNFGAESHVVDTVVIDNMNINPDAIKVDIEFSEYQVIPTMLKTLERCRPLLLIEFHHDNGMTNAEGRQKMEKLLFPLGYKIDAVFDENNQFGYRCSNAHSNESSV